MPKAQRPSYKKRRNYKEHKKYKAFKWYSSIMVRLISAFMISVIFVIAIGAASYQKASAAIIESYKNSSMQAIEMTGAYIRFALESVETDGLQYITNVDAQKYFGGRLTYDPLAQNTAMNNVKMSIMAKQISDNFIEDIHILSQKMGMVTTSNKTRPPYMNSSWRQNREFC